MIVSRSCRLLLLTLAAVGYCSTALAQGLPLAFLRPYKAQHTDIPEENRSEQEEHVSRKAVKDNGFYDSDNPELLRLQQYDSAVAVLPKDANGFPDWMRALREGTIKPKAGLDPAATMGVLDLDVIMKNTKEMPNVRFPHNSHTQWLDCSNCHPRPFEPRAGATKIAMADIFRGKYCGMCHDRVAFITFFSCQRCHSVPQKPAASAGRQR